MTGRKPAPRLTKSTEPEINGSEVHEEVQVPNARTPDTTDTEERTISTQSVDIEPTKETHPELRQFPSLHGDEALEVEKRQQPDNASGSKFTKVFRVGGLTDEEIEGTVLDEEFLDRQHNAVREEAHRNGLRCTGLVEFDGHEKVAKNTWDLKFSVSVVPAVVAEGFDAIVPSDESKVSELREAYREEGDKDA